MIRAAVSMGAHSGSPHTICGNGGGEGGAISGQSSRFDRTVRGAMDVEMCHPRQGTGLRWCRLSMKAAGSGVKAGTGTRTSETSTTHVRPLMCLSGMRDSTHFLIRAIASWSGGQGGVPR